MPVFSGQQEHLPYSLSRWTDLPTAKWDWFKAQLEAGQMRAFDPRTAIPVLWSLAPEDTLGLIFWTKNPENLIRDRFLLTPYKLVIHMTMTGWEEEEKGAPSLQESLDLMQLAVRNFGVENVTWRFSPVPMVENVLDRFEYMAKRVAGFGLPSVYVAFLQENDLMPEQRPRRTRVEMLKQMATRSHGLKVLLCNEDRSLGGETSRPEHLMSGICESGRRFVYQEDELRSLSRDLLSEGCGCALAVDPFTVNETCTMGCRYCYAADKSLADKKRNTTKFSLPMVTPRG